MGVPSLGREDPLGEGMAAHSSILAWRISWTEGLAGHVVHGLKRIGHDLATKKRWFVLLILRLLITFFMVVEESMGGNLSCKKSFNY